MTIQQVALATFAAHNLPDGMEPTLDSDYVYDPENFSYPHGTHLCAVEIDTETGFTKIRKYVCVDDIGKIINPVIVEGQVHGGLAQGIAQALYEEAVYDAEGNLTTGSLVDYLVPAAPDLPHFDTGRTETPSTSNPLGVKGVGEAGTIASTPGGDERRRSTRCGRSGSTTSGCPRRPERVWRALHGDGPERRPRGTVAYGGAQTAATAGAPATRPEAPHDPRPVRLRRPHLARPRPSPRSARPARTPRSWPAGRA
jgi:carbon-monoxide dehydrogenase large subunit